MGEPIVRFIQPYRALKVYLCPGCEHEVAIGIGHYVVWYEDDAPGRRHWHRRCWEKGLRPR